MLPPHRYYYLHNFQRALAWVSDRYADLLDEGGAVVVLLLEALACISGKAWLE